MAQVAAPATAPPTAEQITLAIGQLKTRYTGALVNAALRQGIEGRYAGAHEYADAVEDQLYIQNPASYAPGPRTRLAADDRQRCLIALLATRREQFPIAIHMYIGLMEDVSPEEMRNVLFLVAVYAGVPSMVSGIDVLNRVLAMLVAHVAAGKGVDPLTVIKAMKDQFD